MITLLVLALICGLTWLHAAMAAPGLVGMSIAIDVGLWVLFFLLTFLFRDHFKE